MQPGNDRGRPGEGGPAMSLDGDGTSVPRCALCGHHIYARESVAAGIGQSCRRRLARALRYADDETRAAYAAAVAWLAGGAA